MALNEEERRFLFERIAETIGERAARAMSDQFDEANDEDPGIVARFDQQDAALNDLSGRMGRVEAAATDLSGRMDRVEHAVTDLSGRMDRVEHAVTELQSSLQQVEIRMDARFDVLRSDIEGLLHREIGVAIASQTRTVLLGILAVTAAMFAMLLTMNQVL